MSHVGILLMLLNCRNNCVLFDLSKSWNIFARILIKTDKR